MKTKTKPKTRDNILTPEERERMCKACENDQERLVVYGLLYTGMRGSEFLHMRKSWIDFKVGIIHVPLLQPCNICSKCKKAEYKRYKYGKDGEKTKLETPTLNKPANNWKVKTPHAQRTIPIVPELRPILEKFFSKHNSVIEMLWYRQNIWRIIKEVGKKARIRNPFPHAMRGTFATILVEKGLEDAVTLKEIMGWAKLDQSTSYIRLGGVGMKKRIESIW